MKRILLLSMGGTIFSVVEKNVVRVAEDVNELLERVPRIQEIAEISFRQVCNVDSTNVGVPEWLLLLDAIRENYQDYDAFVVAHGTNTMAYTATALALALGANLTHPIVFTGSQKPLTVYGDDAHFNLEHSVMAAVTAAEAQVAEVMVCFHDVVLRGCRTVKVSESDFRAFASPAIDPLARVDANGITYAHHARRLPGSFFTPPTGVTFSDKVICIDLVPGLSPNVMQGLIDTNDVAGIVIKSHGAGSVPDQGTQSLLPLIKNATVREIPVIVTSKFLGGNSFKVTNDEPAVRALEAGAITSRDMTDVAAQVKLMYLLGAGIRFEEIRQQFGYSIVGEVTA